MDFPVCLIRVGEPLIRHWSLGAFKWKHTPVTRGWSSMNGSEQAEILFKLLKPADQYNLDCASHYADDSRTNNSQWYRETTFNAQSPLNAVTRVNLAQRLAENVRRSLAR